MKFKSRKGGLFIAVLLVMVVLLLVLITSSLSANTTPFTTIMSLLFLTTVLGFILWIFFDTSYELSRSELRYQSGPFKGCIAITAIKEVIVGKSLYVGLKPATSRHGIIIKYNTYDEIYISPLTNQTFVKKLQELNSNIIITT